MFIREVHPLIGQPKSEENDRAIIQWLEKKFKNERLCAVGQIDDYFIFLEFERFCQASVLVQNKFMEKMKTGEKEIEQASRYLSKLHGHG